MCLACEMDELWMLYLEQQAAKHAAEATPIATLDEPNSQQALAAPVSPDSQYKPQFICEEPAGE
jgi:hypothetical protein